MIPRRLVHVIAAAVTALFVSNTAALLLTDAGSWVVNMAAMTILGGLVAFGEAPAASPSSGNRPRHARTDEPTEPRPDADWVQYLNDDDRAWLAGHGWTDPTRREPIRTRSDAMLGHGEFVLSPEVRAAKFYPSATQHLAAVDEQEHDLVPVPRTVRLLVPDSHDHDTTSRLAWKVLDARVPRGSIRDGQQIHVRLCSDCDELHSPVAALRSCTC